MPACFPLGGLMARSGVDHQVGGGGGGKVNPTNS